MHREHLGQVSPRVAAGVLADRLRTTRGARSGASVADVVHNFLEFGKPHWASGTLRNYTAYAKEFVAAFGRERAHEITPPAVRNYLNRIAQRSSKSTANRHRQFIRAAFSRAVSDRLGRRPLIQSPFPKGALPAAREQSRDRILELDEQARVLTELPERYRGLFLLALLTGLRQANLFTMEWSWVDFDRMTITIPAPKYKTRKPHIVPLINGAKEVLLGLPSLAAKRRFVFEPYVGGHEGVWSGRPMNAHNFAKRIWPAALKRAGVEDFRWHDLRHTTGTRLADLGAPMHAIQSALGHLSILSTRRYVRDNVETARLHMAGLDTYSGPRKPGGAVAARTATTPDFCSELDKLVERHEKGHLDDDEFRAAKNLLFERFGRTDHGDESR